MKRMYAGDNPITGEGKYKCRNGETVTLKEGKLSRKTYFVSDKGWYYDKRQGGHMLLPERSHPFDIVSKVG